MAWYLCIWPCARHGTVRVAQRRAPCSAETAMTIETASGLRPEVCCCGAWSSWRGLSPRLAALAGAALRAAVLARELLHLSDQRSRALWGCSRMPVTGMMGAPPALLASANFSITLKRCTAYVGLRENGSPPEMVRVLAVARRAGNLTTTACQ